MSHTLSVARPLSARALPGVTLVLAVLAATAGCQADRPHGIAPEAYSRWSEYLGDPGRSHFSTLAQIDTSNVATLEVAWEYASGGLLPGTETQIQHNPLIVDSVLYGVNASLALFAVDARTGRELWTVTPGTDEPAWYGRSRGLMRWVSPDGRDSRIYFGAGSFLHAVDPATGLLDPAFGDSGRIDLRRDLGRDPERLSVSMNTPGAVFEDRLIVGSTVDEGPGAAPGYIRAYHARTGALVWTFRTIPLPGEPGHETWPADAWTYTGGANSWAGMALDPSRGLVFVGTGSAAFDYYGGDRAGDLLYANSLLALDARTGRLVWHQQFVRHDIWDRDLPAPPNLVMVERNGRRIPAVAQITKDAHVWVFDRETGEPLFPIEEFDVPPSKLLGERAATKQRFPTLPEPFSRQVLTADDLLRPGFPAYDRPDSPTVGERFAGVTSAGQFVPLDTLGVVIFPGLDGGGEWGGAAVDPQRGRLYVNASEMAWILRLGRTNPELDPTAAIFGLSCARCHGGSSVFSAAAPPLAGVKDRLSADSTARVIRFGRNAMPAHPELTDGEIAGLVAFLRGEEAVVDTTKPKSARPTLPYAITGFERFLDAASKPVVKPPWGTLTSIDLNTGERRWQVPLGDDDDIDDARWPVTGTENYGGPVVTAGGLVFIAATRDEKIRAFHERTGELLWEAPLPAGGYATPATYEVGGRQYLVIACGGGKMGTASGDRYVAFALPE